MPSASIFPVEFAGFVLQDQFAGVFVALDLHDLAILS
jgi:hypothetical protein